MTVESGVPGATAGHPVLARLVADPAGFAAGHWGRAPLHTPGTGPDGFADLFGVDAVDTLLSERGLRTPFLRLAKQGRTAGDREFTGPGGVGALIGDQVDEDKVLQAYADGSTIVLQGLHRTWAPLLGFGQALAAELGHPVQVNAYVTPDQNRGFEDHYDVHDVFVLQVAGEKHWQVRPPVWVDPLRDQPWTGHRRAIAEAAAAPPLLDLVLRPGDCLYLPRGYLHSATARGRSVHLTVGVHVRTRHHLIEALVDSATALLARDRTWRAGLPLAGHDDGAELEAARQALVQAVRVVAADEVRELLAERARADQRPEPVRPLAQFEAARRADLGPVRLRAHLMAEVSGSVLVSRAGRLPLTGTDLPAVRELLKTGQVDVDRLGHDLVRRLMIGGVLIPAGTEPQNRAGDRP